MAPPVATFAEARSASAQVATVPPTVPDPAPHQPAFSLTDSPTRGQPSPIHDPARIITGGFGDQPQYFPLTGPELKEIVRTLFDTLNLRLDQDLRFGLSSAYPQVRCTVTVTVDGSTDTAGVNDVTFDLTATRLATLQASMADTPDTPPDLLRDTVSLPIPRKQVVSGAGTGRPLFADVPTRG